jgi:hypothetical protein
MFRSGLWLAINDSSLAVAISALVQPAAAARLAAEKYQAVGNL